MTTDAPPFSFDDPTERLRERRRLAHLRNTGLLSTPRDPALDAVTRLAAQVTGARTAAVGVIDADSHVDVSRYGPGGHATAVVQRPLERSPCAFVVANDAPLVMHDAKNHPLLLAHPALGEDGLAAFAAFPVRDPVGQVLGALWVMDTAPRQWTATQLSGLHDLATAVETSIALRLSRRETMLDHKRLLQVLDGAAHTVIVIADARGTVLTMNRAAEEATQLNPGELRRIRNLTELAAIAEPCGSLIGPDGAQDWMLREPRGEARVFSVRFSILHDNDGTVDGYVVVGDDVSVRREIEDALRDTVHKQAEIVQRLEDLDAAHNAFVATASHELRTPVTSILGYTEMLIDGTVGELTEGQNRLAQKVDRNGQRLLHLVGDLLSLARVDAHVAGPARNEVDVPTLVQNAWDALQAHLSGRRLRTAVEICSPVAPIAGDAVELERALSNLLQNAVKFTPDDGSVELMVSMDAGAVHFEVRDSGIGIAREEQQAVFEPFFRSKQAQTQAIPGSGVGLSVVRRIVEAHGGTVSVHSEAGAGTTISFSVPRLT